MIEFPRPVVRLIRTLNEAGYEAYAVGGCVRDALLGRQPNDWDLTTSALPEQIKACFANRRVIETGIKHGTVTVLDGGIPYEITTYRLDGAYSDHRRPDSVEFVSDLKEDLRRRDFTVNAMACHPETGVVDLFGGTICARASSAAWASRSTASRRTRCAFFAHCASPPPTTSPSPPRRDAQP